MRFASLLAAALIATAAPVLAQHAINGTWRFDPSTAKLSDKPDRFEIRNGVFTCSTCDPKIRVAADGAFHAVPGHPYWDEIKVDASAPDKVAYAYRKNGREVATTTETVSADGRTLTSRFWSINNAAAKPREGETSSTRVGASPAGAHRTSGAWRAVSQRIDTDDATRLTFQVDGDMVRVVEPTGETVTAKLNGGFAPNQGDVGGTEYAYTAPSDHVLLERARRGGKEMSSGRYTVSPDGRTMTAVFTSHRDGGVTTVTATKQ